MFVNEYNEYNEYNEGSGRKKKVKVPGLGRGAAGWLLTAGLVIASVFSRPVRADIYSYKDENGRYRFTNIKPRGRDARKWKILYRSGPGKASSRKNPKGRSSDVVPARDRSKDRYHRFDEHIYGASRRYNIPVALIRAVIHSESDFDPRVVSSAGAQGLMQLMPGTAKEMGVEDPFDPRENIYGGVRYLRILANRFKGNLLLTIAGYHAGPGAVRKFGGIPPYSTTHRYVRVVVRRYYRNLEQEKRTARRVEKERDHSG